MASTSLNRNWFSFWTDVWARSLVLSDVCSADILAAHTQSAEALRRRAQLRLDLLIEQARHHSPFYARHLQTAGVQPRLHELPVVTRTQLMKQFDHWATDRAVTRDSANNYLASPERDHTDYLERYVLWTSSGTCGEWGVFVHPSTALALYDAEFSARCHPGVAPLMGSSAWGAHLPAVLIAAIDGPYAGVVTWRRAQRAAPWLSAHMHTLSVKLPLQDLVTQLNQIQPSFIAAYPSVLHSLADEQIRGTLKIAPQLLWSAGEGLPFIARQHIERTLGCTLINDYGASECMSIAFECSEGRMHLNSDWVVLEAVDADYRPTPQGQSSHTCLLTHLANPLQPLIRYDLGDSITEYADACPCGCPRSSFSVSGRSADVLHLARTDGSDATLFPLALQSVLEEEAGITLFQLVQTAPDHLRLHLGARQATQRATALRAVAALREFLAQHGVKKIKVDFDNAAPHVEGSGKLRQVVALHK